jgi:hypothetical protein
MAVHDESLTRILPFYKFNPLVACRALTTGFELRSFLSLIFAVLRSLYELSKSDKVATFRWKLSIRNNRRNVGEIVLNGEKCMF